MNKGENDEFVGNNPSTRSGSYSYYDDIKQEKEDNNTKNEENKQTDVELANDSNKYSVKKSVDVENNRYPYCIVWTPLPLISWIIPIIGHTGICK
jgi:hypothetical protein